MAVEMIPIAPTGKSYISLTEEQLADMTSLRAAIDNHLALSLRAADDHLAFMIPHRSFGKGISTMKAVRTDDGGIMFWCPGCDSAHHIPAGRGWTISGNLETPTVSPSLLVHHGEHADTGEVYQPRCHSFIRGGRMEYCSDSEHGLAGQTVEIPDWRTSLGAAIEAGQG